MKKKTSSEKFASLKDLGKLKKEIKSEDEKEDNKKYEKKHQAMKNGGMHHSKMKKGRK